MPITKTMYRAPRSKIYHADAECAGGEAIAVVCDVEGGVARPNYRAIPAGEERELARAQGHPIGRLCRRCGG